MNKGRSTRFYRSQVKAFTLLEITLAMLISAIVLGIAYSAFSIVTKSLTRFEKRNEALATLNRLDELLRKDFYRSDYIGVDSLGIRFVRDSTKVIRYCLIPHFLIRKFDRVDSFPVEIPSFTPSFEGTELQAEEISGHSREDFRVDGLSVKVLLDSDTIPYRYTKVYSAQDLIHR